MIRRLAYALMIIGSTGILAACATEKKPLGTVLQTNDLVFTGNIESLPDKVNVYTAMARAAKYHADASAQNMFKNIYDGSQNPQQVAEKMFFAGQESDKLYNAARAMDFADMYAMSVLTDNQKYIENALYAKSAQNLSVAAIQLHREEIFAVRAIRQIDRMMTQQGKILQKLNDKADSSDGLTEPEINYRKDLEVALNRLGEIRKQLALVRKEYMRLIKTTDKDVRAEGKRFYELDDFDKRYTPDIFQDTAVNNRREFSLAKEQLGSFNAAKARRQAYVDYPPVARLDINGLEVEDSRYENELFNKTVRVTMNLLDAVAEYQDKPSNESLKQKAFDELAAVVMTQVELAYRLVEKASFDYEANRYKITELKNTIRQMKKQKDLPDYAKTDLLEQEISLIAAEQKEVYILAERAAALRNLYYLAGLSPFDKNMLKGQIKNIENTLKKAFNKDLVSMLSAAKAEPRWDDGGNAWAHKDNWLEELIDGPEKAKGTAAVQKTSAVRSAPVAASRSAAAGKYRVMQLGSYQELDNAVADQKRIKDSVPELAGYDIYIEQAVVNGTRYHRLMLRPEPEKLQYLCRQVIEAGFGCILK